MSMKALIGIRFIFIQNSKSVTFTSLSTKLQLMTSGLKNLSREFMGTLGNSRKLIAIKGNSRKLKGNYLNSFELIELMETSKTQKNRKKELRKRAKTQKNGHRL